MKVEAECFRPLILSLFVDAVDGDAEKTAIFTCFSQILALTVPYLISDTG